ncbi:hypothetical protein ACWGOK_42485 [Streptomyces eurythermus]
MTRARSVLTNVVARVHEPHWFTTRRHPEAYEAAIRNGAIVAALQDTDPYLYERLAAGVPVTAQH